MPVLKAHPETTQGADTTLWRIFIMTTMFETAIGQAAIQNTAMNEAQNANQEQAPQTMQTLGYHVKMVPVTTPMAMPITGKVPLMILPYHLLGTTLMRKEWRESTSRISTLPENAGSRRKTSQNANRRIRTTPQQNRQKWLDICFFACPLT